MKKALFFGIYDPEYSRNKVLMQGFRENGWSVLECRVDPRASRGLLKYLRLFRSGLSMRRLRPDLVIAAFPGQTVVPVARLLFPRERVLFDAFTSLYDSNVFDRKLYGPRSLRGRCDYFLDRTALRLSGRVMTDTQADASYLQQEFGPLRIPIRRVFVGSVGSSVATAQSENVNSKIIHFHGSFIPLQGIEYILRAAKIIEDRKALPGWRFRIIGSGQEYKKMRELANSLNLSIVDFVPRMSFAELVNTLSQADIVLGIFGKSPKASRVIPNKVFEALSLGKSLITADTPAVRELLVDGTDALLCKPGDAQNLADTIIRLAGDPELRVRLADGAHSLFKKSLSSEALVKDLLDFSE